jgi:predicted Na+-dependent transporter
MFEFLVQFLLLVFVISSMASMGLGLTLPEILVPLQNRRMLLFAMLLNFVFAPAVALGLTLVLSLDTPLMVGLVLVSTAAGAPFLPKLVQVAKADVAGAVGLMVILMVTTVVFLPIVLPILLTGVEVSPWDIARSLIVLMLLPLGAGLFIRSRYGTVFEPLRQTLAQSANISLILLAVLGIAMNFQSMLDLVGSRGLIAIVLLILVLVVAGQLVGGPVLALATGQRNISAALLIAGQNFGIDVVTYIIVASLLSLVTLFVSAGELGRRSKQAGTEGSEITK